MVKNWNVHGGQAVVLKPQKKQEEEEEEKIQKRTRDFVPFGPFSPPGTFLKVELTPVSGISWEKNGGKKEKKK